MKTKCLGLVAVAFGGLLGLAGLTFAQGWRLTSAPITNWSAVASSADGSKLVGVVTGGSVLSQVSGPIYTSADSGATWTMTSAPLTNWTCVASSWDGTNWPLVSLSAQSISRQTRRAQGKSARLENP